MKKLKSFILSAGGILSLSLLFASISIAQDAPKLTDPEIASVAVTANQIDIDYATIAQKKSTDKEVIRFATTMQNDHKAVIDMAVNLVTKLNVTPKTNAVTQSLLDGAKKTAAMLNSKSGKAFDKAYIDNEVAYHEAVIAAVETILIPQAQNAELKALLEKVLPSLRVHLKHAKMVQKNFK